MTLRNFSMTFGALAVAGVFVAGPSHAAGTADKLKAWDPDKDGTISMTEAGKAAEARFKSLESDNDGTLDAKEMGPTKVDKTAFAKADPDNDGTLDKSEYLSIVEARFRAADPDNDGTLTLAELDSKAGKELMRLLK